MLCVTTSVFWCLSHRQLSCLPIFWGFLFHPLDDFIESTHQAVSFANMKCQHKHRYIPKSSVLFLPIASITLHPTPTHTHQPVHSHKSYPSPQDSALASPNGWGSSVVLALIPFLWTNFKENFRLKYCIVSCSRFILFVYLKFIDKIKFFVNLHHLSSLPRGKSCHQ